jgi:hypothetical protein
VAGGASRVRRPRGSWRRINPRCCWTLIDVEAEGDGEAAASSWTAAGDSRFSALEGRRIPRDWELLAAYGPVLPGGEVRQPKGGLRGCRAIPATLARKGNLTLYADARPTVGESGRNDATSVAHLAANPLTQAAFQMFRSHTDVRHRCRFACNIDASSSGVLRNADCRIEIVEPESLSSFA